MSSSYRRICLNHNPPLRIDWDGEHFPTVPPVPHEDHVNCRTALGRYSYPLTEIWLPTPYQDRDGKHAGRWYDVSWMRDFPEVARAIVEGNL